MLFRLLLLLGIFAPLTVKAVRKVWQWSNDFHNPSHWEDDQIPCSGQSVVIQDEIVFLSKDIALGNLNLAPG